MEMKKADVALDKAIESGDPQLGRCYILVTIVVYLQSLPSPCGNQPSYLLYIM